MRANKCVALALGLLPLASASASAVTINTGSDRGDANLILTAVFNDAGSELTSGSVVIWDTQAADPTDAGLGSYVTTTTTADSNLAAGVVHQSSILNQGIGMICVYGPHQVLTADSTDRPVTSGDAVGTTTVAGQVGTGTGLGVLLRTSGSSVDRENEWIFINPSNAE